jgi:GrpB-like predicted nucleotidyltransferase (UPF0157 family)
MDDKVEPIAVELVPHRAEWAGMAQAEAGRLKEILGNNLVTVHHIGSTSIPGILAKPIVDLIPVVCDLAALDEKESAFRARGYRWLGEFGLPGRRYCTFADPATGKRIFQLHCYQENGDIARHLAFRDYLRSHPLIAKEYEMEKLRAAAAQPDNTLAYNAEKNGWIKRVEKDALAWVAKR